MSKILSTAAMVLALTAGSAFAQMNPLEDPAMMGGFYTDNTMSTMKSADEMKAYWSSMSADNQKAMKDACTANQSEKLKDFCGGLSAM